MRPKSKRLSRDGAIKDRRLSAALTDRKREVIKDTEAAASPTTSSGQRAE